MMIKIFRAGGFIGLMALLTALTQVGGLVLLMSSLAVRAVVGRGKWKWQLAGFAMLYTVVTFAVVPPLAKAFGRVPIAHSDQIRPTRLSTVLLNRNYVVPRWNEVLANMAPAMSGTGAKIRYLDANFPFPGFGLPPHLSHKDGKKLDLSFVYETPDGVIVDQAKSTTGYGAFELPRPGEPDESAMCAKHSAGGLYQLTRWFSLGTFHHDLQFSTEANRRLLAAFFAQPAAKKGFLEAHLRQRVGTFGGRLRHQGCHSVRHDDHIHLEIH